MAFCANCGTQAEGSFCPNCGNPLPTGAGTPPHNTEAPPNYQQAQPVYQQPQALTVPGLSDNVAGALCYLAGFVTGIVFLILAPYNQSKFVRFHAFQAIFFHVGWIVIWFALHVILHGFALFLYPIMGLGGLVLWLYLMYSAFNNKKVKLPIVGDLAEKQA